MNANIYMLEKEWLEHKMITRIPLALLVCGLVLLFSISMNSTIQSNVTYELTYSDGFESSFALGKQLSGLVFGFVGLLSMMLTGLYFPKTLRKERQEGSLMFWRSMPVTDIQIHLVKLCFGLLVVPVICSMLVLSADFMMWLINFVVGESFPLFDSGESFFYIITHWFEFVGRMWLIGLALLPFATLSLAVSQKVNSPLLVILVTVFVAQLVVKSLIGTSWLNEFLNAIFLLPLELLTAHNPMTAFANAGMANLLIYALIGALGLLVSLKLSKSVD